MSVFMLAAWTFVSIFSFILSLVVYSIIKRTKARLAEFISECTLLLVLATLIIGSIQLDVQDKRNKADFLLDLKDSFYNSNATNRQVMEAIDYGDLKLVERRFQKSGFDTFTDYELDEYLINFDYINIYVDQGVLDLKQTDQIFGWYVRSAWANPVIQNYIKKIRRTEPTVYINFEALAKRLKR
ncbi:MAG: hypothetical protein PHH60_04435 [Candidatus Margulisbacteria bacterium]|nr:hypothetical protein [Candidatus Margulisiibacteriota bacterium]